MTERCWEELRRAGKALAENSGDLRGIVTDVAFYFELPRSPAAEAVQVFLDGLRGGASDDDEALLALEPLPEAAQ